MPSEDDRDELINQITVDAYGDECYWSFLRAIEEEVTFPFTASLVGMVVVVTGVDFDGNERRGLVATVEHEGTSSTISMVRTWTSREPTRQSDGSSPRIDAGSQTHRTRP
jgi:hypothetical protein